MLGFVTSFHSDKIGMLAIRLRPVGRKGQRSFRVVVTEASKKLKGKFVEDIGFVNRHTDEARVDKERVAYWLSRGAQPSDTVYNLLVRARVVEGPKRPVHSRKPKKRQPEAPKAAAAPTAEEAVPEPEAAPAVEEAPVAPPAAEEATPEAPAAESKEA